MKKKLLSLLAAAMMLTACSAAPAPTEAPVTAPIEEDNLFGYTLKASLENKTDLELMFTLNP